MGGCAVCAGEALVAVSGGVSPASPQGFGGSQITARVMKSINY